MHIIERFAIHFFSSAGVLMCALFALRFGQRRLKTKFLPDAFTTQMVFCSVVVLLFAFGREAFDVHYGQSLGKAIADYVSWLAGCGCSIWGLTRLRRMQ